GGAGSEVRWFEINTATTPVLSQTGTVTDPELYSFNGAISSDRAADDVTTTAAATGRNMVMGFNTSSAATFSAIKMVSRRGTAPLSGLRDDADVGLRRLPTLRVSLLRLVVRDGARDDHVLAALPVHRRRDLVLRGELHRVDDAQHLVEVASCRHRIRDRQLDLLVRADDVDGTNGLVIGRRARRAGGRLLREHVVQLRDLEILVADHRIVRRGALRLLDVLRAALVRVHALRGQTDDLHVALGELSLELRDVTEFGRTDRSEFLW